MKTAVLLRRVFPLVGLALVAALAFSSGNVQAQSGQLDPALLENLVFRSVGPAAMGGRLGTVEGVAGDPDVIYVGTAAGGIFKSSNAGVTFEPVFDHQGTASIGAIAVAPSDPLRGLRGHRRSQPAQQRLGGRWHVQVDRWRHDLDSHRSPRHRDHRAHEGPSN